MGANKIIDKINKCHENNQPTVSFEFFPAKTEAGVFNLLNRVEEMGEALQPTFVTLTWRSAFKDEKLWLKIGSHIQNEFHLDVLLHLTCHLPIDELKRVVQNAREAGIRNILALRGDPPIGTEKWEKVENGFSNAIQLVEMIRKEHGDYFCIAVAGYPEVHTECWNNPNLPPSEQVAELDLTRLKQKQEAGADFIITQFFFDIDHTLKWMNKCREAGITIPILPGYLPIQNYNSFRKFTSWCKTMVPPEIETRLSEIQNDDAAVKQYGIELAVGVCRKLLENNVKSLHFYTMNLATTVTKILAALNLTPDTSRREYPWKSIQHMRKSKNGEQYEEIRPIFWANRQSSYIARTSDWDDYPNGRWGDRKSPAYGELDEYYLAYKRPKVDRKVIWGEPTTYEDIFKVFLGYIDGTVRQLPWCEQGLSGESNFISENLRWINSTGFLTINSQPRVNGVESSDPDFGWGPEGGYVFQKAYVEFFASPELVNRLLLVLKEYPNLSYHAVNMSGAEFSDTPESTVNAVTWGVFPAREVLQPTVVDSSSFLAWKTEAFELWISQWASAYEKGSKSYQLIEDIYQTYYLVNIVDNDYTNDESNIFSIFKRVITDNMTREELAQRVNDVELQNEQLRKSLIALKSLHSTTTAELRNAHEQLATCTLTQSKLEAEARALQAKLAFSL